MGPVRRLCTLGLAVTAAALWASPASGAQPQPRRGWPLAGQAEVVRGFAPPAQAWQPGHRGVDLLGRPHERVRSTGDGVVHFVGRIAGVDVVSILLTDGLLTTYEPVRPLVRAGQHVRNGQPIGRLTRVGSHCAPAACLHWGLRRGTTYLDPLSLVGAAKVRLWPLHGDGEQLPPATPALAALAAAGGLSRAGRRACRAAAAPLSCASDRSGSR
ncbi:MAG TPA: M23 family metallopeptidase [Mycobacteriales bacterium]|nr:M23 family metallopeptidase [Mycobacteriales bacterium]